MRLLALLWVLGGCGETTVLFLGTLATDDAERLRTLGLKCRLHALGGPAGQADELAAVHRICATTHFDVCIIERIALHFLLDALPDGIRTVLDSHDLESDNAASRMASGIGAVAAMDFEQEIALFSRYDKVMLIQTDDYTRVRARLGERAILAPHPAPLSRSQVRPASRRLGLVASAWAANLHGLDWFADTIWPRLAAAEATLHLYGWISDVWRPGHAAFARHGFVADLDLAWGGIDIAINPVLWGSGLKIKNVEALGHGLPLVTTSEGAHGMREAVGEAFILADDPAEFAEACRRLLDDPGFRRHLGERAHAYARERFSPEACFGELLDWLG